MNDITKVWIGRAQCAKCLTGQTAILISGGPEKICVRHKCGGNLFRELEEYKHFDETRTIPNGTVGSGTFNATNTGKWITERDTQTFD